MSNFENEMNRMFGGSRANYSVTDIEEAKKRQKKYGGTLYDNLSAITQGRSGQKPLGPIIDNAQSMLSGASKNAEAAMADITRLESTVKSNADEINKTLSELNKNIRSDFEFSSGMSASAGNAGAAVSKSVRPGLTDETGLLEKYNGLSDKLKKKVFGQDEYIKKLVIAFKRPPIKS